jgi:putative aldouronate transport system substrate-binding protein
MNTAPDGKIYGLTQLVECYHCSYPNKMWINSSWLKKLNLQMPKTLDEFKQVLEAFKTKDPNGNGKADEVPLSGSTEEFGVHIIPYFMNGFIYDDDRTYLLLNNGKVDMAANKEEWKQGLQFIKSMYDEGLIDKGAFTQNAAAFKKLGDNADAQILGAGAAMHPYIFVTGGTEQSKTYDPVPPLTGPKASYATYNYPSDPGASFVLTNKASKEAQIAAIKLVDYLFTQEGQIRGHFGEEGLDWRKPKDGDVPLEKSATPTLATIPSKQGDKPHNSAWGAMAQYFQPKAFRDSWVSSTDIYDPAGYERRLQEATHLYDGKQPKEVFPHWAIWIDPSAADEAAMLKTNIKNYIDQNALQFITGAKDLNKDWDSYVDGLNKLNLKRYLEIMQQSYDKSFKK